MKYEDLLSELKKLGKLDRLKIIKFLLSEVREEELDWYYSDWRYQGINEVKSSLEKFLDNHEKQDFYFDLEADFESIVKLDSDLKLSGESLLRRTGSGNQYGHVKLEVADFSGESDFLLKWRVDEEIVPSFFRDGVIEGIKYWANQNKIKGLLIKVVGGSYHQIDSRGADFRIATGKALDEAFKSIEYKKPEKD